MIFKKSVLTGNAMMPNGKLLEFVNQHFETLDEKEIEFLKDMGCYEIVSDKPVNQSAPKQQAGQTGTLSSATVTAK